jgi:hypothetical protein
MRDKRQDIEGGEKVAIEFERKETRDREGRVSDCRRKENLEKFFVEGSN